MSRKRDTSGITFVELEGLILAKPKVSTGKGISERSIAAIERELGVRIVGGYREFLKRFGWASFRSFELNGAGQDVPRRGHFNG